MRSALRVSVLVAGDLVVFAAISTFLAAVRDAALLGPSLAQLAERLFPAALVGTWQFAAALVLGLAVAGTYRAGDPRRDPRGLLRGVVLACGLSFWQALGAMGLAQVSAWFLAAAALYWPVLAAGRMAIELVATGPLVGVKPVERVLFVGDPDDPNAIGISTELAHKEAMQCAGWVSLAPHGDDARLENRSGLGRVDDFWKVLQQTPVDTVVLCKALPGQLFDLVVEACAAAGCHLIALSRYDGIGRLRPTPVRYFKLPFIELTVPSLRGQHLLVKRLIDVVGATAGLVVLAPAFAVIALAIRLDSRGPVFFAQERVGMGGRRFKLWKFRTMHHGADDGKHLVAHLNDSGDPRLFKIPNDPRVTAVGAWLRRWSLDELPQLWNVLKGDMSLVGPRPFFESDLALYSDHHFARLGSKPGITGLWQVSGRSAVLDFEEVVRLDREYIERWSIWLDLTILLRTLPAVFRRTGAY